MSNEIELSIICNFIAQQLLLIKYGNRWDSFALEYLISHLHSNLVSHLLSSAIKTSVKGVNNQIRFLLHKTGNLSSTPGTHEKVEERTNST